MELIKQLREMTGVGMVDCQKALKESGNDLDKAVELLRKQGIAKASKRLGREANEGVVKIGVNDNNTEGYIFEMNSETDFVSRNEKFQTLADNILEIAKAKKPASLEELLALSMEEGTVGETLALFSGTIGEKMDIKAFEMLTGNSVAAYSHLGGKIGVLVALDQAGQGELAADIAMQIAATNPRYITPEEVPGEELDKEKGIYREQLLKEGKPENIIENILTGKVAKYYSEICLVEQEFVKEESKKIKDLLGGTKIIKFVRYSL